MCWDMHPLGEEWVFPGVDESMSKDIMTDNLAFCFAMEFLRDRTGFGLPPEGHIRLRILRMLDFWGICSTSELLELLADAPEKMRQKIKDLEELHKIKDAAVHKIVTDICGTLCTINGTTVQLRHHAAQLEHGAEV
jgi:hypothetical protein